MRKKMTFRLNFICNITAWKIMCHVLSTLAVSTKVYLTRTMEESTHVLLKERQSQGFGETSNPTIDILQHNIYIIHFVPKFYWNIACASSAILKFPYIVGESRNQFDTQVSVYIHTYINSLLFKMWLFARFKNNSSKNKNVVSKPKTGWTQKVVGEVISRMGFNYSQTPTWCS